MDAETIREELRVFKYLPPDSYVPVLPVSAYLIARSSTNLTEWSITVEMSSFSIYGIAPITLEVSDWDSY